MIQGFATPEGTASFASKAIAHKENFRKIQNLTLSNIGIGTYLGNPDLETDKQQKTAIKQSILQGVNVIDTAINYRAQKSERTIGKAISELIEEGKLIVIRFLFQLKTVMLQMMVTYQKILCNIL